MANTIKTFDILPNRLEYFEKRMEKVRNAADNADPKIDFFVRKGQGKLVPLPQHLISRAELNQLADTVKIGNDWFRDVIPFEVEYGDLTNLGFDYIGYIQYAANVFDTRTGMTNSGFFPEIIQPLGMTDKEHQDRVAKIAPELNAMAAKFTDYKSIGCDHCNPNGDGIERHEVYIVQSTKDQVRRGGRKGSKGFPMNLKKGQILQLGTGCMDTYTGIDVDALAAFYELDREVTASGPNGSPNNPAGWGWKDMGIYDYADRLVQYFGMREQQWLKSSGTPNSLWEVKSAELLYGKGSMAKLYDGNVADGEGCFIESKGSLLLQARMFNLYENDPTKDAKWLLQPFGSKTTNGGVKSMQQLWEDGKSQYGEYKEVMFINEMTGNPVMDPVTGSAKMIEELVPSAAYIETMLRPTRGRYGRYNKRGDWALTIVDILPPALESKYVENTRNRMLDWIKNADPKKVQGGKYADLVQRLKSMVKIGYVGPKSIKYATELWRMFSFADFDRRKKASKKEDIKLMKSVNEAKLLSLGFQTSGMKWYKINDSEKDNMYEYTRTLYPHNNYTYLTSNAFNAAYSGKFDMVLMTPAQHGGFAQWNADRIEDEKKEAEKQRVASLYRREVNRIQNEGYSDRYNYGYPRNRSIPYTPTEDEFLAALGWFKEAYFDKKMLETHSSMKNGLWTLDTNSGAVSQAKLNDKQFEMVKDKFRPQVIVQGQVISPTISTPTSSTSSNTRPKIAQAAAKRMGYDARGVSTHQGTKGGLMPLVEGYVTFVSRPFYRRGMGGAGHTITLINPDTKNAYVVFYYGQSLPIVGNYYNLFDVDVESHTSYQGLAQTIITDSAGGQVTFTDATS